MTPREIRISGYSCPSCNSGQTTMLPAPEGHLFVEGGEWDGKHYAFETNLTGYICGPCGFKFWIEK